MAIVEHIDAVIGMNQPIGDKAAIRFAEGFYRGLGAGKDVEFAYRLGRNSVELQGIAQENIPVLMRKGDAIATATQPNLAASEQPSEAGPSRKVTVVPDVPETTVKRSRVFISYKRDVEPDEPVAQTICSALQQQHEVFIDQKMLVGTPWAERIERELESSDVLIVLLSAHSVQSEMVEHEVELAYRFGQAKRVEGAAGCPRILPVRLAYRQPFQYPLSRYLDPLNWAMWTDEGDTAGLIEELLRAIAGEPLSIIEAETATPAPTSRAQKTTSQKTLASFPPSPTG